MKIRIIFLLRPSSCDVFETESRVWHLERKKQQLVVVTLRAQKEDWRDTSQKRFNIIILDKCVHLALLCAIIILQTRAKLGTWRVDYCSFNASTYRLCLKCEQFIALLKIYFVLLLMSVMPNYVWFLSYDISLSGKNKSLNFVHFT